MTDRRKIVWLWCFILGAFLALAGIRRLVQWVRPSVTAMPTQARESATLASPVVAVTVSPGQPDEPQTVNLAAAKLPAGMKLIIPVQGIKPEQLRDTYADARSAGRTHNAIDIMVPRDTPVLAAADGEIARFFTSTLGGTTLYQLSKDRKVVFYYAHLDHYAEGLSIGRAVQQGEVIAYVGDTGNAGAGNYHLHFGVWLTDDPKRFWSGVNLNPYPLLKESQPAVK